MSAPRGQSRWLIPTFAVLTVAGLVLLALAVAGQVWLVVVAGAFGVVGNGAGLWNQLAVRRRTQARVDDPD